MRSPRNLPSRTDKTTRNLRECSRPPDSDLNLASPGILSRAATGSTAVFGYFMFDHNAGDSVAGAL